MWRIQNQGIRDYTCFSAYHKSHSRIDYFLLSSNLKTGVDMMQVLPATLSDHNPLLMTIHLSHRLNKTQRWRFNTTLLQDEVFVTQFRKGITEFVANNIDTVEDASYIWMATKGYIRDFTSFYASHLKKERNRRICELERQCHILETRLKGKYSKLVEKELRGVRLELNDMLRRRAEFIMHRVRQGYYFNGSKPSRLLALKLKQS